MLAKQHRLRRDNDFKRVFKTGKNVSGNLARLRLAKNKLSVTRFAVVVGTKVSKRAVKRNELRRRVQEVIRLHLSEIAPDFDVVLMMQPKALGAPYETIEAEVLLVLKKAKLLV